MDLKLLPPNHLLNSLIFFIIKMLNFFNGVKRTKVISMDFALSLLKLSLNMPRHSIATVERKSFFF
jgi:hypothetical protein